MKIFETINQSIKEHPEIINIGVFNREDMDEEDLKELGSWEPEGEGEFTKDIGDSQYRIYIESKNTR